MTQPRAILQCEIALDCTIEIKVFLKFFWLESMIYKHIIWFNEPYKPNITHKWYILFFSLVDNQKMNLTILVLQDNKKD